MPWLAPTRQLFKSFLKALCIQNGFNFCRKEEACCSRSNVCNAEISKSVVPKECHRHHRLLSRCASIVLLVVGSDLRTINMNIKSHLWYQSRFDRSYTCSLCSFDVTTFVWHDQSMFLTLYITPGFIVPLIIKSTNATNTNNQTYHMEYNMNENLHSLQEQESITSAPEKRQTWQSRCMSARHFLLSDASSDVYFEAQRPGMKTCTNDTLPQKPSPSNPRHRTAFYRNR